MERSEDAPQWLGVAGRGAVYLFVSVLLVAWLLQTPPGLLGKADAIGYAVCHRIDLRSFHLGDRQLPLCTRCSGMYLGAMWGLAYQALRRARRGGMPPKRVWVWVGMLTLAFVLDGLNSYFSLISGLWHLYPPSNTLRLITGTGMGLVIAFLVYPTFNQTVWRAYSPSPSVEGLLDFALLLLGALVLDAIVLTENPLVLYPLALISAAGVLVVLTLAYTLIGLMIRHQENRFNSWRELTFPVCVGFGLALLQIIALDLVRFLLTGSWEGFHLG